MRPRNSPPVTGYNTMTYITAVDGSALKHVTSHRFLTAEAEGRSEECRCAIRGVVRTI